MEGYSIWKTAGAFGLIVVCLASPVAANDFGVKTEKKLHKQSKKWFGFKKPLTASASSTVGAVRVLGQKAKEHVLLAKGLKAHYLTREAGDKADQFNFWPDDNNPTHAIFCIEGRRELIGSFLNGRDKYNPAVQRINLFTGNVETILRGISRCDGLRRTPWGTILATEETSDGGAYEILSPLSTTNHTVTDRALGTTVDINGNPSSVVRKQIALPVIAWEGIGILESGVIYAGDELRPGSGSDNSDGGAIFKFIPQSLHAGGFINQLSQSPLAKGNTYAFQASCRDDRQQFGQGCEIGNGVWIPVSAGQARSDADAWGCGRGGA